MTSKKKRSMKMTKSTMKMMKALIRSNSSKKGRTTILQTFRMILKQIKMNLLLRGSSSSNIYLISKLPLIQTLTPQN